MEAIGRTLGGVEIISVMYNIIYCIIPCTYGMNYIKIYIVISTLLVKSTACKF